ncbi:MAG: beta-galactosidase [Candidatus Acidiferrales bacterium]
MRYITALFALIFVIAPADFAKTVVFWQEGFPTIASQAISREALAKALEGLDPVFANLQDLNTPATLTSAQLLVLPYGSAVPVDAWKTILDYLQGGGNLLILGGQPLRVPVALMDGKFEQARPQDTYSRELDFRHSYAVPAFGDAKFAWRLGYSFFSTPVVRAQRFFAVEGHLDGLGYMVNSEGTEVAAPVIVSDHSGLPGRESKMRGVRIVALDFEPAPDYWASQDGISLVGQAAEYARQGATSFWIETLFSALKPGEPAQIVVHLHNARQARLNLPLTGEVQLELLSGTTVLDTAQVRVAGGRVDENVYFRRPLAPGFYVVRGTYSDEAHAREFYQNGFWVEDETSLKSGPVLGVHGDFITRDGKPFFPVGTNYFDTEENGWDFSGPRNAWNWERDFAEMEQSGVTFVRTGVWMPYKRFVEPLTGEVNERFLRNLEAYLLCAHRHNIAVNFTFFAFVPRIAMRFGPEVAGPDPNAYIDPASIRTEQDYMLSIVNRFKDVPWLCWDLINEPNFSNPQRLWKGNVPNGDPAEVRAWHEWLRKRYGTLANLGAAWAVTPEELGSFDAVPLPSFEDMTFDRYGNARHVRAFDYSLFAQDMFTDWVRSMVTAIRSTGSTQMVDVGQDEGGVKDRVLNQFYAEGGVSFTTNHTYWQDDALLWDSVAAKRQGVPNISGETGYQPVWSPDGKWRYDEITGEPLLERKWALGFAAGSSGVLQWDWAREPDFGMKRSDGSAKTWQAMMRGMGAFAQRAEASATGIIQPQIAIVLPQSLQLSTWNAFALEAQQTAVRALYQYARAEAYAVGEYQIEDLGNPKLIIVPSPFELTDNCWQALAEKVKAGAILLISGRFDMDAHFHATGRQAQAGLDYQPGPLTTRENILDWPLGKSRLTYSGIKTTYLDRAFLPGGASWAIQALGKGKIIFATLPLELNDNLQAVGDVYKYAVEQARVAPTYTTSVQDPGILICPTRFPEATLYVITSESDGTSQVSFQDRVSGKSFSGEIRSERAAMLLVGEKGNILASYGWK